MWQPVSIPYTHHSCFPQTYHSPCQWSADPDPGWKSPAAHTGEETEELSFHGLLHEVFFSLHIRLNVHPPQLNQLRQDLINTVVLHHAANTPSHSALSYLSPAKYTLLLPFKNEKQPENVLLMAKS